MRIGRFCSEPVGVPLGDGVAHLIGPMNGSTWGRYRLALPPERGETTPEPPFLTEPRNPPGYPDQFRAAGFSIAVRYESRIVTDLGVVRPRAAELSARIAATGVRVRSLTPDRLAEELRAAERE